MAAIFTGMRTDKLAFGIFVNQKKLIFTQIMASSDDPITVPIERYITQLLDEVYFYKGGILLQVSEWRNTQHIEPKI